MKLVASAIGVALVLIYVVGSGLWVNTGDGWYRGLNQPFMAATGFHLRNYLAI